MTGPSHDFDRRPGEEWDRPEDDLDVFEFVDHGDADAADEARDGAEAPSGRRGRRRGGSHAARRLADRRTRTAVVLAVVGLLFALVVGVLVRAFLAGSDHDRVAGDELTVVVKPGEDLEALARRLDEDGVVRSAAALRREAQEAGVETIVPGAYVLRERMPAADALDALTGRADGAAHPVYVEPGRRLAEVLPELAEATGTPLADLEAAARDPRRFGVPEPAADLEGWLDPGEVRIPVDSDAEAVLGTLVERRLAHLREQGVTDPAQQHRVVTLASILQAEALPQDYRRVAGVIENRLAEDSPTHGLLQVDSTVTYGLGVRSLQFSADQRDDASNAYNTYRHPGLPPGPIGMPTDAAVDAALDPQESGDYFWVTTDIATGHTEFSATYEEHRRHQEEFRRYCQANPDVCS